MNGYLTPQELVQELSAQLDKSLMLQHAALKAIESRLNAFLRDKDPESIVALLKVVEKQRRALEGLINEHITPVTYTGKETHE